jgi:hypothetical protein
MMKNYIKPNTKYASIVEDEMMLAGSLGFHDKEGGDQLGKGNYESDFEEPENSSIWDD